MWVFSSCSLQNSCPSPLKDNFQPQPKFRNFRNVPSLDLHGQNLIYLGKESFIEPRNLSTESSQCSSDLHLLYVPALPIKGPRVFTAASIKKKFSSKDLPKGHHVLLEGNKEWDICKVQGEGMRLGLHSPPVLAAKKLGPGSILSGKVISSQCLWKQRYSQALEGRRIRAPA